MKVSFTIDGDPVGKGRPRVTKTGRAYTPKATQKYEAIVKTLYKTECKYTFPEGVPLDVRITSYHYIPSSASRKLKEAMRTHKARPCKKPDVDNIVKIILDSLNRIAYHDDAQVVDLQVRKFYSDKPRVVVTIQEAKTY